MLCVVPLSSSLAMCCCPHAILNGMCCLGTCLAALQLLDRGCQSSAGWLASQMGNNNVSQSGAYQTPVRSPLTLSEVLNRSGLADFICAIDVSQGEPCTIATHACPHPLHSHARCTGITWYQSRAVRPGLARDQLHPHRWALRRPQSGSATDHSHCLSSLLQPHQSMAMRAPSEAIFSRCKAIACVVSWQHYSGTECVSLGCLDGIMSKYPWSQQHSPRQHYDLDDLRVPKPCLDHVRCMVTTDPRVSLRRRDTGRLTGIAILRLGQLQAPQVRK